MAFWGGKRGENGGFWREKGCFGVFLADFGGRGWGSGGFFIKEMRGWGV